MEAAGSFVLHDSREAATLDGRGSKRSMKQSSAQDQSNVMKEEQQQSAKQGVEYDGEDNDVVTIYS